MVPECRHYESETGKINDLFVVDHFGSEFDWSGCGKHHDLPEPRTSTGSGLEYRSEISAIQRRGLGNRSEVRSQPILLGKTTYLP